MVRDNIKTPSSCTVTITHACGKVISDKDIPSDPFSKDGLRFTYWHAENTLRVIPLHEIRHIDFNFKED